jgi:hypothetical protein
MKLAAALAALLHGFNPAAPAHHDAPRHTPAAHAPRHAAAPEIARLPRPRPDAPGAEASALLPESPGASASLPEAPGASLPLPPCGGVSERGDCQGADAPSQPADAPAGFTAALPRPRPEPPAPATPELVSPEVPASPVPAVAAAIESLAPLPRPRPANVLAMIDPGASAPEQPVPAAPPALPAVPVPLSADDKACLANLRSLGVAFTEIAPIAPGSQCAVPHPLNVTALGAGIELTPAATLNCRTAEALALWVKESVAPAARRELGAVPRSIVQDSAYVCRPRNNQEGAKLSEHAHANAIDIASIGFSGRAPVGVEARAGGTAEARFQATIRVDSCRYFTTSLGPGTNAAHATHFHFDAAERRGGYRLCDLGAPAVAGAPANTSRE